MGAQNGVLCCARPGGGYTQAPLLQSSAESQRRGRRDSQAEPVTLHIYDIGKSSGALNWLLRPRGTGIFHCAVEVYGFEWSFSDTPDPDTGSGVFCCVPKKSEGYSYREPVAMGETHLSQKQVTQVLYDLEAAWLGMDYHVLNHNCCHFSDDFCKRLGLGPIPGWIRNLSDAGEKWDHRRRSVAALCCGCCGSEAAPEEEAMQVVDVVSVFPSAPWACATERSSNGRAQRAKGGAGLSPARLIFLDVDGPLAPWVKGKAHEWQASDQITDAAYASQAENLRRIVERAESVTPDVQVLVVISSTWRGNPAQYDWLCAELGRLSIRVVGFTDLMDIWPNIPRDSMCLVQRFLEIYQCLLTRRVAVAIIEGPQGEGVEFRDFAAFGVSEIVGYIAIDDLPLDQALQQHFPALESKGDGPKRPFDEPEYLLGSWDWTHWETYAAGHKSEIAGQHCTWSGRNWMAMLDRYPHFAAAHKDFRESHFVLVSSGAGVDEKPVHEAVAKLHCPYSGAAIEEAGAITFLCDPAAQGRLPVCPRVCKPMCRGREERALARLKPDLEVELR